ncbi:unnamed protein product [Scytosiphon promiscuus]
MMNDMPGGAGGAGGFNDPMGDKPITVTSVLKEFQGLKDKFKNEDEDDFSPYQDLEKATVLQECRVFSDSNVVTNHPRRCGMLITKLLYILNTGETLSSSETTEVFFGVTKLFQSQDHNLRRMMYLFIKEVAETCDPDDVIIVTSSLTKDMNSSEDLYRANSIRVLSRIIDATMLGAIERYLKQAIVDKNALVSSSALVSGILLYKISPEVVRRWVNEVTEGVSSQHEMVQYHALSLLYQIKAHDKLAVSKLVTQLSKSPMRSPLAVCLLIRYMSKILHDDISATNARAAYQFLESSLRHRSEMVMYEAARAICNLPGVEMNDLSPAINVLQMFLTSVKPALKFGTMRTLSEVAAKYPMSILKCNPDMEVLISDPNRSIATLAITTLLKTGSEGSVDRLMKQISSFMNEIADEFKIVVVKAIRQLCLKYPLKHRVLVGFLATFLREEGGFEFKKAITDCIVELMTAIPETKEMSLFHLCDFIEDCEFTALSTQILSLVGDLGPSTSAPARYIRFIYNRVILENAAVRAAAVPALAKFAARLPSLRPSIRVLIKRSLLDEDDEVRDRATMALTLLGDSDDEAGADAITGDAAAANGGGTEETKGDGPSGAAMPPLGKTATAHLLLETLPMSFSSLEKAVKAYHQHMPATAGQPLVLSSLPVVEEAAVPVGIVPKGSSKDGRSGLPSSAAEAPEDPAEHIYKVPELASLGRVFRSTAPVELTESETEYVVRCVKHIMDGYVVLDFTISNTIEEQMLRKVFVEVEQSDPDLYEVEKSVALPELKCGDTGHAYVVLKLMDGNAAEPAAFSCELKFQALDVDPATGLLEGDDDDEGFEEEYPLEQLNIATADFMAKVSLGDFRRGWEQMGAEAEVLEKFALGFKRLQEAVAAVEDFLGMQTCDGTGSVSAGKKEHALHLCGIFVGNVPVLVRAQLNADPQAGCILKIAVRSNQPDVSRMVADCIQ